MVIQTKHKVRTKTWEFSLPCQRRAPLWPLESFILRLALQSTETPHLAFFQNLEIVHKHKVYMY